jgi:hypothetical protein
VLQVRFEAERAREQSQQQLAAAEGRAAVLQTRLDDVLADNSALKHKVSYQMAGSAYAASSMMHLVAWLEFSLAALRLADTRTCPLAVPAFDTLDRCWQAGLEETRASQLEALVGSLRSAAYRAAADSQAHGSRAAGAECRSAQLQAEVPTALVSAPEDMPLWWPPSRHNG